MAVQGTDAAQDVASDSGAAGRDTLIELLSIVSHDVNNPLQSLIVLLELSVDDAPVGSDARARAEQCQIAADRIRALTTAMAGLLRGRREDGPRIWLRAQALLGRRFDRMGVRVDADLSALADVALPSAFFFALCGACLIVISTAGSSGMAEHHVRVVGALRADVMSLEFTLVADGNGPTPPPWDAAAAARLRALVAGEDELFVEVTPACIRLWAPKQDAVT